MEDSLSPVRKTHHSTAAIAAPAKMSDRRKLTFRRHPGLNRKEMPQSKAAEHDIAAQKLTCGAVHGENITDQSTNARRTEKTSRQTEDNLMTGSSDEDS